MKIFALFLIRCYKFVSQMFPPRCRFQPSCSSYAYQAIEIYGFVKGSYLSAKRILRCHPFCNGGVDPVPVPLSKKKN
ncbi:MAG: membrane protein insertion efficiency factor YidD [Endomicrobium sp.]|jgi:putative membrane protein insertion efficiency factor|nr:membrane protein insertion efficiency factor YidD [Endomicrobium sp.]